MKIKLDAGAVMPTRAHRTDAGLDLYSPYDVTVRPKERTTIDTGVHMAIPEGYVGLVKSKSGLMVNHGLTTDGVVDAGYTGSVRVTLFNHSYTPYLVLGGQKIGQIVILPCLLPEPELAEDLAETERGENGFGSSGC